MEKITGTDLISVGYKQNAVLGIALKIAAANSESIGKEALLIQLQKVNENPENYLDDPILEDLATKIIEEANAPKEEMIPLNEVLHYPVQFSPVLSY